MSRFLKFLAPSLGGVALVLGAAYMLADQFVVDVPAPLRDRVVPAAMAQGDADAAPGAAADGDAAPAGQAEVAGADTGSGADRPAAPDGAVTTAAGAPQGDPMPESVVLKLGRPATQDEIAAWDIDVRPDGQGLPVGSGNERDGEALYVERCASCHGDFGEAVDRWPVLAGGQGTLTNARPVKTIGSYWPFASTVFDYVHRAMPFGAAQTLTDDEVYAIVAHLLYLNDLVPQGFELSNENFAEIRLPNEENFFADDRGEGELPAFRREVCMEACKESVEITMRAAVLDVTPEDAAARERLEAAASADAGIEETDAIPPGDGTADGGEAVAAVTTDETTGVADDEAGGDEEVAVASASEETDAASDPDLVAAGETAFRQCKACHQVGEGAKSRTGPHLNDVFGRVAGSVEGFRYSKAFEERREAGLVWNDETLAAYLEDPKGYIKGTKMSFRGFRDAEDIDAVLAYLRTFEE